MTKPLDRAPRTAEAKMSDETIGLPEDLQDEIENAIVDSFDVDWQARHGAAAIMPIVTRVATDLAAEVERLKRDLAEVSRAVGSWFMDPPDGGDVTVGEQVRRMCAELDEARKGVLWAVHVRGPDDVQAVASYEDAVLMAEGLTWWFAANIIGEGEPAMSAMPALWTGTPEQHAANLAKLGTRGWDYTMPTPAQVDAQRDKAMAVRAEFARLRTLAARHPAPVEPSIPVSPETSRAKIIDKTDEWDDQPQRRSIVQTSLGKFELEPPAPPRVEPRATSGGDGWQPMSELMRDGRPILCGFFGHGGRWVSFMGWAYQEPHAPNPAYALPTHFREELAPPAPVSPEAWS